MKRKPGRKFLLGLLLFAFCLTGLIASDGQNSDSRSNAQEIKRLQMLQMQAEKKLQWELRQMERTKAELPGADQRLRSKTEMERRGNIRELQMGNRRKDVQRLHGPEAEENKKGPKTARAGTRNTAATVFLTVDAAPVGGNINPADDPDYYQFTVVNAGYYAIETWLGTLPDSYMYLYGPDNPATPIELDDDDGTGSASKIWRYLSAGTYYVTITAFSSTQTGTNTISVVSTSDPGGISGRVTNTSAVGIQNIRVHVYDLNQDSLGYVNTDASGNYTFSGLPGGNYKVYFNDNGLNYFPEWYNDKSDFNVADQVPVTAGSTTPNINAQLATGGQVSGRVTNTSAVGIRYIRASVFNLDNSFMGSAWTNASGDYTITGLTSGSYKVFFYPTPYSLNYLSEWYNDKADFSTADQVAVTAGNTTSNINAQLAAGGSISGQVTDTSAAGIQYILVDVYDLANHYLDFAFTDASGNYTLSGLPSGNYKVFFAETLNYLTEWYNDKGDFATADQVAVTAGSTTPNINAQLAAGGVFRARSPILQRQGSRIFGSRSTTWRIIIWILHIPMPVAITRFRVCLQAILKSNSGITT